VLITNRTIARSDRVRVIKMDRGYNFPDRGRSLPGELERYMMKESDSPRLSEAAARWGRRSSNDTASTIMTTRFLAAALTKIIVTLISQASHRCHSLASHWYSDTPAPLRWPIPRSRHLRSHSTTTSHSSQSHPTRIDHAGWTASIKLAGTLYDAP
jgi:hypothetical protein